MTVTAVTVGDLELIEAVSLAPERNVDLLWDVFAPVLAGRPLVRVSRDGGLTYPRSSQRRLGSRPTAPAAVPLFDAAAASGRVLLADLDVSRGGLEQVRRDCERLEGLLSWCGGRGIVDESPAGGRHVYVLWEDPIPFEDLLEVARALATQLPSMDIKPNSNLTDGAIRPPGATHKAGGVQTLVTPYAQARAVLSSPNSAEVWSDLVDLLAEVATAQRSTPVAAAAAGDVIDPATIPVGTRHAAAAGSRVPQLRQKRSLPADMDALARLGTHPSDPTRYATPSDARQAVLTAAATRGWAYEDVRAHLQDGTWAGLASCYSRYSERVRTEREAFDWLKAVHFASQLGYAHNSTTRDSNHTPPAGMDETEFALATLDSYAFLRAWWSAYEAACRLRYAGKAGLSSRLALRALLDAAQKQGTRWVEFGSRSLSIAVPAADSTIRAALQRVREEPDPLVILIRAGRGVRGDLYELRVPDAHRETARWRPWQSGRLGGMHPVWRVLGPIPGMVYELLDPQQPTSSLDLATRLGYGVRVVQQALAVLTEHQLARGGRTGWCRGEGDLDVLAVHLGAIDLTNARRERYRTERRAWWAELAKRAAEAQASVLTVQDILDAPQTQHAALSDRAQPHLPWRDHALDQVDWWNDVPEPPATPPMALVLDHRPAPAPPPDEPAADADGSDAAAARLDALVDRIHAYEQRAQRTANASGVTGANTAIFEPAASASGVHGVSNGPGEPARGGGAPTEGAQDLAAGRGDNREDEHR